MRSYLRPIPVGDREVATGLLAKGRAARIGGVGPVFATLEHFGRRHGEDSPRRKLVSRETCREDPELERILGRIEATRPPFAGCSVANPLLMGIVNVTPDSFSDGGQFLDPARAAQRARALAGEGADLIDFGGESTRPGAREVSVAEEVERVVPAIRDYVGKGGGLPVSIDTRKATVAMAALEAGAGIVNDVSALTRDPDMAGVVARSGTSVCLMHSRGEPATMQDNPVYRHVVVDVYDWLEARVEAAVAAGIDRDRIAVDPGIGFGKTLAHNLALLQNIGLFHGLGCPVMLGASRKRFVGGLSPDRAEVGRVPGSLAVAVHAVANGVQLLRVHDVAATAQALAVHGALTGRNAGPSE